MSRADEAKCLGIFIGSVLKWDKHITAAIRKTTVVAPKRSTAVKSVRPPSQNIVKTLYKGKTLLPLLYEIPIGDYETMA